MSLILVFLVAGCAHASVPSADDMARNADQLEATFPTLEHLQVRGFRTQDWCQFIDYPPGSFSNLLTAENACNLFASPPKAFDNTASADFGRVKKALSDSGVGIDIAWNIKYDDAGQISAAEFDVTAGAFDRFSYLYDRDKPVSSDGYQPIVFQQINQHWWFLSDDWN
ncbi:MAG: hypothetical protein QOI37_996 [Chloroflexota bacterium]|jgi:hypothetical protein|nr:hypothetical protein [Chloroflexota bacterium]